MRFRIPLPAVGVALSTLPILVATLRPDSGSLSRGWSLVLASGDAALAEVIQNLLLFVPFGLTLALSGMRPLRAIALGTAFSFTVEFIQQWLPGRDPSLGDIVCNTAGTGIGGALCWIAPRWLLVGPRRAAWQSLTTALLAASVWLGTGWLLQPALPAPPHYARWRPDLRHWGRYQGRVLSATLGPLPLSGDVVLDRLDLAQPLRVVAVAPAPPPGRRYRREAPLVAITDDRLRPSFLVAVSRADLALLYRTRAAALTLEQPELRAPGALADLAPGDTFTVAGWRQADGGCLTREDVRWCGLGYTVGDGWKLIFFPDHFPRWLLGLLNAMWVGGTLLGVGHWARRGAATGVAVALIVVALLVGPTLVGLRPTPNGEIVGALAGLWLGWGLRFLGRRSDAHRTPQSAFTVRH